MKTIKTNLNQMTLIENQKSIMEQALICLKEIEVMKQCRGILENERIDHVIKEAIDKYSDLMIQLSRTFHSGVVHQSSEWVEPR